MAVVAAAAPRRVLRHGTHHQRLSRSRAARKKAEDPQSWEEAARLPSVRAAVFFGRHQERQGRQGEFFSAPGSRDCDWAAITHLSRTMLDTRAPFRTKNSCNTYKRTTDQDLSSRAGSWTFERGRLNADDIVVYDMRFLPLSCRHALFPMRVVFAPGTVLIVPWPCTAPCSCKGNRVYLCVSLLRHVDSEWSRARSRQPLFAMAGRDAVFLCFFFFLIPSKMLSIMNDRNAWILSLVKAPKRRSVAESDTQDEREERV